MRSMVVDKAFPHHPNDCTSIASQRCQLVLSSRGGWERGGADESSLAPLRLAYATQKHSLSCLHQSSTQEGASAHGLTSRLMVSSFMAARSATSCKSRRASSCVFTGNERKKRPGWRGGGVEQEK